MPPAGWSPFGFDPEEHAAEAKEPLEKVREELHSNFHEMHDKAEEEAAEVLVKVKESIHNATYTTVQATFSKYEEKNAGYVKDSLDHAKLDSELSANLTNQAMEAVQKTME